MSLSSSEAEYIALSGVAKEAMFVIELLETMKISAKHSVTVRVDNVGAIFMVSYIMATSCTKYVVNRYTYVNKYLKME